VGADPGLVNLGGQDFHLTSGSACRDAAGALASGAYPVGREYVKHQQNALRYADGALDIGAYEYCATGCAVDGGVQEDAGTPQQDAAGQGDAATQQDAAPQEDAGPPPDGGWPQDDAAAGDAAADGPPPADGAAGADAARDGAAGDGGAGDGGDGGGLKGGCGCRAAAGGPSGAWILTLVLLRRGGRGRRDPRPHRRTQEV
jgi:hypothetical protein